MVDNPQQRVLDALQDEVRTWDELQELTKLSRERLGLTLGELFDLRKIRTEERNGVRVYYIERKVGLMPRFQSPHPH